MNTLLNVFIKKYNINDDMTLKEQKNFMGEPQHTDQTLEDHLKGNSFKFLLKKYCNINFLI